LTLSDRLPGDRLVFNSPAAAGAQPNLQPVIVEHQSWENGELVQQQEVVVPYATVNMQSNTIAARGPGFVVSHTRNKSSASAPATVPFPIRQPDRNSSASALTFVRTNFDQSVLANLSGRDVRLVGNVRVLYAPVETWTAHFDPDQAANHPGSIRLTCDQLQLAQWTPRGSGQPTSEMIAKGNAHVIGDLFESTADRISYNQATDILVIEGSARTDAHLWYQQDAQSERVPLVAGKILYRPSDQWTEIQRVKNATIIQTGSASR
jgi:hypothetical protein